MATMLWLSSLLALLVALFALPENRLVPMADPQLEPKTALGAAFSSPGAAADGALIDANFRQLSPAARAWLKRGTRAKTGHFVVDLRENSSSSSRNETLLVVHGFPTSSLDFAGVADDLLASSRYGRVVLADLLGLGFSAKPDAFGYTIGEQVDALLLLWRDVLGLSGGHLLCHDLGDSVCTELLSRQQLGLLPVVATPTPDSQSSECSVFTFQSVCFTNGGLHIELASFRLSQALLRMKYVSDLLPYVNTYWFTRRQLLSVSSPSKPPAEHQLRDIYEINRLDDGQFRLPRIARYVDERFKLQRRWLASLAELSSAQAGNFPVRVIWGTEDAVAPPSIARQIQEELPNARVTLLEGLGHFLMLEDPEAFLDAFLN